MSRTRRVTKLLDLAGRTYAEEAGITLRDKPAPLYRLLVLSILLSTRIKASIAVAAARELRIYGTPRKMLDATWQQRVDALGRGHYVRYDESTATALGTGADGDVNELRRRVQQFPRRGPVGADIFGREARHVWPELRPYVDAKAVSGARAVGLPEGEAKLAALVDGDDLARFTAALVRADLDKDLAAQVRG